MLLGSAPYKDAPKGPGGGTSRSPTLPKQFTPWGQGQQRPCHQATPALAEGMSLGISGTALGHLQGVSALFRKGP